MIKTTLIIITGAIIIGALIFMNNSGAPQNKQNNVVDNGVSVVPSPGSGSNSGTQSSSAPKPAEKPTPTVSFISPATGDSWKMGASHTIRWSVQLGVPSGMVLVDNTNVVVGWISAGIAPN